MCVLLPSLQRTGFAHVPENPQHATGRVLFGLTLQLFVRPPSDLTGLAGELVLNDLVIFAGRADPAAADLALSDHLTTHKHIREGFALM